MRNRLYSVAVILAVLGSGLLLGEATHVTRAWAAYFGSLKLLDYNGTNLAAVDSSHRLSVTVQEALPAGSALVGHVNLDAQTGNGATPYHLGGGTAASTNSTNIKGSAGNLLTMTAINTTVTIAYLKLYDNASTPTCSSATGIKHVYPVPPASAAGGAGGFVVPIAVVGESYPTGIAFCVTGGGTDTDNTNAPAGVFIEASYK